ncbi:cysteine synthase-like isoform X2 [Oryza glaberrima]|uniref:cysteine synthase-like isoform X2 n=1 Tax=Oryza glaberrima TaxID=4538 RepID=UPI00224BEF83|nr:cysteine synthase-like isoform X2 [Oryza glaberrima]
MDINLLKVQPCQREQVNSMEEGGRRGIPSLLNSSSSDEHIATDITQLVGWTPLIELNRIVRKDGVNARIVGKLESYQPLCSVKDRSALRMIEDAEEKGLISPGVTTLVEPTSGNLGIGVAYNALLKGYRFIAVMPAEYSLDKQMLLTYLGAEVILTDPTLGFQGQLDKVEQIKNDMPNVHHLDQFKNAANPEAHFVWTGPEIWKDTAGKVDIFVAGSGTGGTISGVGKYLKMKNPAVKVICVEPAESPVISGGKPSRHKIQGMGPGFVPKNLDISIVDEIITVTAQDAMANAKRLAREEGLLVGISSGANLAACLKVASRKEYEGKMIVTIFPSGGERYMNSDLFAQAREECSAMTF